MNELTTQTKNDTAPAIIGNPFENADGMLRLAEAIKDSSFIPAALRGDPGNAFLAIELAGRTGLPLMATLQGMYVIEGRDGRSVGKPSFYANFIHALIRRSGAYIDTYYEEGENGTFNGKPNRTCRLVAVRADGSTVTGPEISLEMAAKAGWSSRNAAMWNAYTQTMLQNRAVTFFARQCCPELIFGIDPDGDLRSMPGTEAEEAEATPLKDRLARFARTEPADAAPETAPAKPKRARAKKAAPAETIEPEDEGVNFSDAAAVLNQTIKDAPAELGEFALWYANKIDAAETIGQLEEIGRKIKKDFAGPEAEKIVLRKLYADKEAELNG